MDERQQTPGSTADRPTEPVTGGRVPEQRPRPVRVPTGDAAAAGADTDATRAKQRQRARTKVCGITRIEDAEQAVELGAWAIGMILWRGSKRRCRFERAQAIGAAFKRQVEVAGVFVNATLDEVDRAVDACQLTIVQLHGDEGPSYCAEVARRTGAQVIKAARVRTAADVVALRPFHTDYHLLDAFVEGRPGGTGRTFDHELARVRRAAPGERPPKLILSGGLTADNVGDAIAHVRPFAVDVASGTEQAPGVKDPAKVAAFIAAVRDAWDPPAAPAEPAASASAADDAPAGDPAAPSTSVPQS